MKEGPEAGPVPPALPPTGRENHGGMALFQVALKKVIFRKDLQGRN